MSFIDDSMDNLDANIFTGDSLHEFENTVELYTYLHRWSNECKIYLKEHLRKKVLKRLKLDDFDEVKEKLFNDLVHINYKNDLNLIEYIWQDSTDNYKDRKESMEERFLECVKFLKKNI